MPDLGILLISNPETPISRPDNVKQPFIVRDPSLPRRSSSNAEPLNAALQCPSTDAGECTNNCKDENVSTGKDDFPSSRVTRKSSDAMNKCSRKSPGSEDFETFLNSWKDRKIASGVPENRCVLPFLVGAPKSVECHKCWKIIHPGNRISCTVRHCRSIYHFTCAKEQFGRSATEKKFKCHQHACYVCKRKNNLLRCIRCSLAVNIECAAWPEKIIHLSDRAGWVVCWRHLEDWRLEKSSVLAENVEDIFCRLPVPYLEEEYQMDLMLKDNTNSREDPPSYVAIKRNVYLVKKKLDSAFMGNGCTCGSSKCNDDCLCRVQCISCSKACHCSDTCGNKPFRKEKKIKLVKTKLCGWGAEALQAINKGDFIIEYVGEVIDDALCEQRLWRMKEEGAKQFYMCEIQKDFIIDASFKGNLSRFLNHSCEPNCKLEKWQVDGELRVGVFAAQPIKAGEPLTYDYRFVQFGPEVDCQCGSAKCQGFLGSKKKPIFDDLHWGSKRKRNSG